MITGSYEETKAERIMQDGRWRTANDLATALGIPARDAGKCLRRMRALGLVTLETACNTGVWRWIA